MSHDANDFEKWDFDNHSFEYAARFVFKFNEKTVKNRGYKTWQELADAMKSMTQEEFWRHQRGHNNKRDLNSLGFMGFDITIVPRNEDKSFWVKASLSPSFVHNALSF